MMKTDAIFKPSLLNRINGVAVMVNQLFFHKLFLFLFIFLTLMVAGLNVYANNGYYNSGYQAAPRYAYPAPGYGNRAYTNPANINPGYANRRYGTAVYPAPERQNVYETATAREQNSHQSVGKQLEVKRDLPKKIMFLYAGHTSTAKAKLIAGLGKQQGIEIKHYSQRELKEGMTLSQFTQGYGLLIFDTVNANEAKKSFSPLANQVAKLSPGIKTLAIRWPLGDPLRKGITEEQAQTLYDYYNNGGQVNFEHMLAYIQQQLLTSSADSYSSKKGFFGHNGEKISDPIPKPVIYPEMGIYHPDYPQRVFADPQRYLDWHQKHILKHKNGLNGAHLNDTNNRVIGITLHQETLAGENMLVHDAMIRQVEQAGATPLVFYYRAARNAPDYVAWLSPAGKPILDVIINTRLVHWAEKRHKEFAQLGVTVLHGMAYSKEEQRWREDNGGVPAYLVPFYLTLSEMAGLTDPIVMSSRDKSDGKSKPITEQLDLLVRKALRVASLKAKDNTEKKVAILYYNYPPGEKNASASFLNITRSIEQISAAMKQYGYQIDPIKEQQMIDSVAAMQRPFYRAEAAANLLNNNMADSLPISEYMAWFESLSESVQNDITESWGKPEQHYMTADIGGEKHFIVPRYQIGNVVILPQPPRGDKGEREKSIYHSKNLAVNHYYLAVYLYLRQKFQVDALVHLGTHGSHEWLPGKERGLWAYDPGNLTADDIPVIYPYIVDDVGEALQAKRRGRAVMISHMTPPFAPSGLYGELSEVHELMHQYAEVDPGLVKKRTRKQLIKKLQEMDMIADMGWKIDGVKQNFNVFMNELHDYMHDLAAINQPLGLHTWGQLPEERLLVTTIMQILGNEFSDAIAAYLGETSENAQNGQVGQHQHTQANSLALVNDQSKLEDLPGYSLLKHVLIAQKPIPANVSEELRVLLERGKNIL